MPGSLPFLEEGSVEKLGGEVVATVDVSVWPLGSARETTTGETYDWMGEADPAGRDALRGTNRTLVVAERRYVVVSVVEHQFLPHLELQLRATGPGGGTR